MPLQGVALTPKVWERDVLPRRLGAYSPAWLDELCTSGELVWIGAGALGRNDGRVALYFREDVRLAGPPPANAKLDRAEGEVHDAIRERLALGPCFWLDLLELDHSAEELHEALWDLAWSGEATNDAFAPLRAPRLRAAQRRERSGRRFSSRRAAAAGTVVGRWSLTAPLFEDAPAAGPRLRAQAELMLERYGIVTRETVLAEGVPGGFSTLYGELTNLELLGTTRRGYFVEGLGGAQFALPGRGRAPARPAPRRGRLPAARRHRPGQSLRRDAALAEAGRQQRRPARAPGAYVLLRDGEPLLYVERGGRGVLRLAPLEGEELGGGDRRARGVGPQRAHRQARHRAPRRRGRDRLAPRGDRDCGRLQSSAPAARRSSTLSRPRRPRGRTGSPSRRGARQHASSWDIAGAVGPVGGHRVVGVGGEHDPRPERDLGPRQPVRVAAAVPVLVGVANDRAHAVEEGDRARGSRRRRPGAP